MLLCGSSRICYSTCCLLVWQVDGGLGEGRFRPPIFVSGMPLGVYEDSNDPTIRGFGAEKFRVNSDNDVPPDVAHGLLRPKHSHVVVDRII